MFPDVKYFTGINLVRLFAKLPVNVARKDVQHSTVKSQLDSLVTLTSFTATVMRLTRFGIQLAWIPRERSGICDDVLVS